MESFGIIGGWGQGGPATVDYVSSASSAADQSSYTFTSQAIGAAAGTRTVFVGVMVGTEPTAMTIGGVSATRLLYFNDSSSHVAIFALAVPAGTAADIVVTLASGALRCGIVVWRALNVLSLTPADSFTSSSNSPSGTLDIPDGGIGIGVSYNTAASARATTWSGLTKDVDMNPEGRSMTGAHSNTPGSATRSASYGSVGTGLKALIAASWR